MIITERTITERIITERIITERIITERAFFPEIVVYHRWPWAPALAL